MDLVPRQLFLLLALVAYPSSASRYIIQVEEPIHPLTELSLKSWHESFLPPAVEESGTDRRLLHSYSDVFSGFAAVLTEEELQAVGKKKGFVRAFPDRVLRVMTTHTPDFLGLKVGRGLWDDSKLGSGVIIGVIDSGVTPGHPSYDDEGVPPPPSNWKGSCELETGCNNKLIGARSMLAGGGGSPPVDEGGHGTHTSATAAGNFVRNVSYFGLAKGTAAGIAPRAHLAIYQVCRGDDNCTSSDILAGLDAAVKDGVDILSISLGAPSIPLEQDVIAIGSFAAVRKGIFVSCAGGNDGPAYFSLSNEAPWILTVAASSVDRSFRASVKLPNGKVIAGESLDQPRNFTKGSLPLYYSIDAPTCLDPPVDSHRGSVWVCEAGGISPSDAAAYVKSLGARALIFISSKDEGATIMVSKLDFPVVVLTARDGSDLVSYLNSSSDPSASIIFDGTILGVSPAPIVAFFSSRGPSQTTSGILKPDISGPGLNILAAWIPSRDGSSDNPHYSIISGTSMATPHLSGIAAILKAAHPTWSPAAIKSAIVTTADSDVFDELLYPAFYFAKGAGNVNPNKAVDPGLIYDITDDDYISYICGKFGEDARNIARESVNCTKSVTEAELNYPSILLAPKGKVADKVTRTVTNVGPAGSRYKVSLTISKSAVSATVTPKTLTFTELNEKKSFIVSAKWAASGPPNPANPFVEGKLTWTSVDGKHVVTSPLVVSAIE
ncbi:subtilisin-like protease 4 [Zingiber officinale]|uniref:subtilisin-like protease 4 n=1 Tax=Zingiber officinale TaxID=94328 RepID=UPI001C4A7A64|nr:subtilisin-like protease 4 [Zingiber officinale]